MPDQVGPLEPGRVEHEIQVGQRVQHAVELVSDRRIERLGAFLGAVFGIPMVLPRLWAKLRHGKDYEMLEVPFGVFLAPAAMIALLWGNDILAWLRSHYPYLPQL